MRLDIQVLAKCVELEHILWTGFYYAQAYNVLLSESGCI